MYRSIVHLALIVRDYDEALAFYTRKLNFRVVEDSFIEAQDKRWVVIAPANSSGASLVLARADNDRQRACIGNQSGGRVFLFLQTDNFTRDYAAFTQAGVSFVRKPEKHSYGQVAVFEDLYGNLWDLVEYEAL